MPTFGWSIAEGRITYTLPGCTGYAVGSSTVAQVDALKALKGEMWGVLLSAFPQIVPSGEPAGGEVLVELECCDRASCAQMHAALTTGE